MNTNNLLELIKQEHENLANRLKKDMNLAVNLSKSISIDLTKTQISEISEDVWTDLAGVHRILVKGDIFANRILYLAPLAFNDILKNQSVATYIKHYKKQIDDKILEFETARFAQLKLKNSSEDPQKLIINELKKRYKIIPSNIFHPFVGTVLLDCELRVEWYTFSRVCNHTLADLSNLNPNTIARYTKKYAASETLKFLQQSYRDNQEEF